MSAVIRIHGVNASITEDLAWSVGDEAIRGLLEAETLDIMVATKLSWGNPPGLHNLIASEIARRHNGKLIKEDEISDSPETIF